MQTAEKIELVNLVRRAQSGENEAFGELYTRFSRHVMAIALRFFRDFGVAEEMVQEVFLQARRKLSSVREPEAIAGWLRAITRRMCINRSLKRKERATELDDMEWATVEKETPYVLAMRSEEIQAVRRGLNKLKQMDRETLVAFYVQGESLVEMSDHFHAPVGTIKRRLHVARHRLAKQVERYAA